MNAQGILAGLIVLAAVGFLLRRFTQRSPAKPRLGPDVPTGALLRKSRRRGSCCDR